MTTDPELLLHRFVDQELTSNERIRLIAELGRSSVLRQRAIEMEELVSVARELPRPQVPAGFAARVLEHVVPRKSLPERLFEALLAPHHFRWNIASAAAAAVLAAIVVTSVMMRSLREAPASAVVAPLAATAASPSAVLVRLVVVMPGARMVQLAGDFNEWNPAQTPLEEASNGAWTVTLSLEPGRYEYMFLVDGRQWIADPFALEHTDDGFGSRNAVLDVRPPADALGAL